MIRSVVRRSFCVAIVIHLFSWNQKVCKSRKSKSKKSLNLTADVSVVVAKTKFPFNYPRNELGKIVSGPESNHFSCAFFVS
jgi:hypothetical protein